MAKRKRRKQKEQHDLDIVIPVYGQAALLEECLVSIMANRNDFKDRLILVDDQGPEQDELAEIYRSIKSPDRLIRNKNNMGFSWTVNRGVSVGRSPLILILNTDVKLGPGAIKAMMAEFDNPKVGVVGAKLLFPLDSADPHRPGGHIQHAGLGIDIDGRVVHPNIGWPADHPKVNERRNCQAVTGACLMTRREVWQKVFKMYKENSDPTSGAFNDVYGRGTYEDVEFCFAARSLDYQVIYTPEAIGYHHVGASALADGRGYPLGRNEMIFKARAGNMLAWDEWRWY